MICCCSDHPLPFPRSGLTFQILWACLFSCHPSSFTNSSQAVRRWKGYDHRKGPLEEGCFVLIIHYLWLFTPPVVQGHKRKCGQLGWDSSQGFGHYPSHS